MNLKLQWLKFSSTLETIYKTCQKCYMQLAPESLFANQDNVWHATIVTFPCSRGSCTWETTHLPCLMAYRAPSASGNSFDVMLSVWRGPSMDSSIRPLLSETSNIMSRKDPAGQLSGTCQIATHIETSNIISKLRAKSQK